MARKILVAEDSEDLLRIWSRLFATTDIDMVACENGESAIQRIRDGEKFEVIVSDYYLPDTTGLDLLDVARSQSADTPFILLTGSREPFIQEAVKTWGNACVLTKPIAFKDLLNKIENYSLLKNGKDLHNLDT